MPPHDIRIVVQRPSGQATTDRINQNVRGEHLDSASDVGTEPPDYATVDGNDVERPAAAFPRPRTPTPSATGSNNWPLTNVTNPEDRPDSSMSYTSSRPYHQRSESQNRKFKRNPPKTINRPEVIANHRTNKRPLSNGSGSSPAGQTGHLLRIPASARLASRRSDNSLPQVGTSGSFATLNNDQSGTGQKKRGLTSRLSHGDWTTIGSFFSQSGRSDSSVRGLNIGAPYDFRHEGGIGTSASTFLASINVNASIAEEDENRDKHLETGKSSKVLMDMRTESRLGNQTSLPVHVPNAVSPIDATHFDGAGSASSTVRGSVRARSGRFPPPPSIEESIQRPQTAATSRIDEVSNGNAKVSRGHPSTIKWVFWLMAAVTQISLTITVASLTTIIVNTTNNEFFDGGTILALLLSIAFLVAGGMISSYLYAHRLSDQIVRQSTSPRVETFFFKMSPERVFFWSMVVLAELAYISVTSALTVVVMVARENEEIRGGVVAWLMISIVVLVVVGLNLSLLYARRVSNRNIRIHRNAQRDEDWIELHCRGPANVSSPDQTNLARDIIRSASQDVHNHSTDQNSIYPNISLPSLAGFNFGITAGQNASDMQNTRSSMIGIARSDSLTRHPDHTHTPTASSVTSGTSNTYESEGTEKPIIAKHPMSAATVHPRSDPSTILTAEEMAVVSIPTKQKKAYIPHSLAVPDLTTDGPVGRLAPSITPSGTKSTISSLYSSYGSEPDAPVRVVTSSSSTNGMTCTFSQANLGRRDEALTSHPVLVSVRPLVTEAGTPDSQKSSDRVHGPSGDLGNRDWSIRDGMVARMTSMTPIEERSEARTRSSVLTGHRISQSQASESEGH